MIKAYSELQFNLKSGLEQSRGRVCLLASPAREAKCTSVGAVREVSSSHAAVSNPAPPEVLLATSGSVTSSLCQRRPVGCLCHRGPPRGWWHRCLQYGIGNFCPVSVLPFGVFGVFSFLQWTCGVFVLLWNGSVSLVLIVCSVVFCLFNILH